ncbi:MAG TPA: F0F1 ATP synthase subunit epsilon [Bacteroidota bacterium]|nr:F0F1 ATP synthase subunit epsilon [Bacteroidota bacterium]
MAGKTFTLEIVTPKKVVFKGDVESFTAPGVEGSFQVLFNHAPLLAATGVGEIKVRGAEGADHYFATTEGFVEVNHNKVVMLADTAEAISEIDLTRAERAEMRARERLAKRDPDTDIDRARVSLQRAMNRIRLARKD